MPRLSTTSPSKPRVVCCTPWASTLLLTIRPRTACDEEIRELHVREGVTWCMERDCCWTSRGYGRLFRDFSDGDSRNGWNIQRYINFLRTIREWPLAVLFWNRYWVAQSLRLLCSDWYLCSLVCVSVWNFWKPYKFSKMPIFGYTH